MHTSARAAGIGSLGVALVLTAHPALSHATTPATNPDATRLLEQARSRQPLGFTAASDAHLSGTAFTARAARYQVALLNDGTLVHRLAGSTADQHMRLLGARAGTRIAEQPLPDWASTDRPAFARVTYRDVYPGIDAIYHSRAGALEYDFDVAPGADSKAIRLSFQDAKLVTLEPGTGVLRVTGTDGTVVQHSRPEIYQQVGTERREIAGRYRLVSPHVVAFEVGPYDHAQRLIIDPTISISRILYGNYTEHATAIAVDASGNSYVTGVTDSTYSFPAGTGATTNHGSKSCTPAANPGCPSSAFIVKLDTAGNIVAQVLFGGTAVTAPLALAVDGNYVYAAGWTTSPTVTTAAGRGAPVNYSYGTAASGGGARAFVARFSPTLVNLNTVTTLSASGSAEARGIFVDSGGTTYLTGMACGAGFPLTAGAFQTPNTENSCDVFVTHLDYFASFSGYGPYYSARFGSYTADAGNAIAVDATGVAWVGGSACAQNFPVTAGLSQGTPGFDHCNAFVMKLDASGSTYQYSMTFGGSATPDSDSNLREGVTALVLNGTSGVYVGGFTESKNFPALAAAGHTPLQVYTPCLRTQLPYCKLSGFVAYLDGGLNLILSTYLAGVYDSQVYGIAKNTRGEVYATGSIAANASGFPGAANTAFVNTGGYVSKLSGSLESLAWTNLFAGPVNGILARGTSVSTGVWTTGDTYPNRTYTDSFMIKLTDAIATKPVAPICTRCVASP